MGCPRVRTDLSIRTWHCPIRAQYQLLKLDPAGLRILRDYPPEPRRIPEPTNGNPADHFYSGRAGVETRPMIRSSVPSPERVTRSRLSRG